MSTLFALSAVQSLDSDAKLTSEPRINKLLRNRRIPQPWVIPKVYPLGLAGMDKSQARERAISLSLSRLGRAFGRSGRADGNLSRPVVVVRRIKGGIRRGKGHKLRPVIADYPPHFQAACRPRVRSTLPRLNPSDGTCLLVGGPGQAGQPCPGPVTPAPKPTRL